MLSGPMRHTPAQSGEGPQIIDQIVESLYVYGDMAGSEALTRALVAERTGNREKAQFWVRVYQALSNKPIGTA